LVLLYYSLAAAETWGVYCGKLAANWRFASAKKVRPSRNGWNDGLLEKLLPVGEAGKNAKAAIAKRASFFRGVVGMNGIAQVGEWLHFVFGGDVPDDPVRVHQAMGRAVVVYLVGLLVIRLGKSRSVGRMTPLDVLLGFVLGSLLSRGITGHASISGTVAASAALVATHWLLTWGACRSHWFGDLVKGHADVIVENGEPIVSNMLHHHISIHDLQEYARNKGLEDVSQVRVAYKERNGEVSVLAKKEEPRVVEVAVEAGVKVVRIELG
jgi:uncharacterized membrane protein YcaP (DUF421 family)